MFYAIKSIAREMAMVQDMKIPHRASLTHHNPYLGGRWEFAKHVVTFAKLINRDSLNGSLQSCSQRSQDSFYHCTFFFLCVKNDNTLYDKVDV